MRNALLSSCWGITEAMVSRIYILSRHICYKVMSGNEQKDLALERLTQSSLPQCQRKTELHASVAIEILSGR